MADRFEPVQAQTSTLHFVLARYQNWNDLNLFYGYLIVQLLFYGYMWWRNTEVPYDHLHRLPLV